MHAPRLAALIGLSLVAAPVGAQPAAVTIDVQNFSFAPTPLHLRAGQPVTLTFVNRSGSGHDFTAARFFANARILAGGAPDGEVELAPHQTRTITLVPTAGTYKAHCSHFLHKQMGMSDVIVVN
jgi:plastocyanin